jgi:hypothetical protein
MEEQEYTVEMKICTAEGMRQKGKDRFERDCLKYYRAWIREGISRIDEAADLGLSEAEVVSVCYLCKVNERIVDQVMSAFLEKGYAVEKVRNDIIKVRWE